MSNVIYYRCTYYYESDISFLLMTVATVRFWLRQTAVMDRDTKKTFRKQVEHTSWIFIAAGKKRFKREFQSIVKHILCSKYFPLKICSCRKRMDISDWICQIIYINLVMRKFSPNLGRHETSYLYRGLQNIRRHCTKFNYLSGLEPQISTTLF
jgi:hypothetical protein